MKNRLSDLNDHLFTQMERLCDDDLTPDALDVEAKRTTSIVEVAEQIVANADLQLRAARLFAEHGDPILKMLPNVGKAANAS